MTSFKAGNTDTLTDEFLLGLQENRKKLVPWWIKIFCRLFLVIGVLSVFAIPAAFFGINVHVSLYGFEALDPQSTMGIFLTILFLFKGVVAFGLLWQRNFGALLGTIDAVMGILFCLGVMIYGAFFRQPEAVNFRLELLLLIPYLVVMVKIEPRWNMAVKG